MTDKRTLTNEVRSLLDDAQQMMELMYTQLAVASLLMEDVQTAAHTCDSCRHRVALGEYCRKGQWQKCCYCGFWEGDAR